MYFVFRLNRHRGCASLPAPDKKRKALFLLHTERRHVQRAQIVFDLADVAEAGNHGGDLGTVQNPSHGCTGHVASALGNPSELSGELNPFSNRRPAKVSPTLNCSPFALKFR